MLVPLSLLLAATVPAAAEQIAGLNVSRETALSYECGETCYETLIYTNADDLSDVGTDFDSEFYAVASNFSTAVPGDLLKIEPINPTSLTTVSGIAAYRIQYVSTDLDGTYIPVSGFIALPYALPDSGKFPLVAWAHGTIGLYPGCAVSNGPNFFDYNSWELLSEQGYALVATDYAGLGTNGTAHKYCAFPAHAMDIYYSVVAARQAFGKVLTDNWMAAGHSQGGGAVWKLAEDIDDIAASNCKTNSSDPSLCADGSTASAACTEAKNFIGTVAMAPAARIWDLAQYAAELMVDPSVVYQAWAVTTLLPLANMGIKRTFPEYNSTALGDMMKVRMGLADKAQLCAGATMGLASDLTVTELTTITTGNMSAGDIAIAQKFQNTTGPGNGKLAKGPVLIIQGVNDTAIIAETTETGYENACATGSEIDLILYPKQDHSGVITAGAPDWIKWMQARFAGEATSGECSKVTKQPFDYDTVRAELEVDLSTNSFN